MMEDRRYIKGCIYLYLIRTFSKNCLVYIKYFIIYDFSVKRHIYRDAYLKGL